MPFGISHSQPEADYYPSAARKKCGGCKNFDADGPVRNHGWCQARSYIVDASSWFVAQNCSRRRE